MVTFALAERSFITIVNIISSISHYIWWKWSFPTLCFSFSIVFALKMLCQPEFVHSFSQFHLSSLCNVLAFSVEYACDLCLYLPISLSLYLVCWWSPLLLCVSCILLRIYECASTKIYGVILFSVIFGYFECDDWIYGNERGSLLKLAENLQLKAASSPLFIRITFNNEHNFFECQYFCSISVFWVGFFSLRSLSFETMNEMETNKRLVENKANARINIHLIHISH